MLTLVLVLSPIAAIAQVDVGLMTYGPLVPSQIPTIHHAALLLLALLLAALAGRWLRRGRRPVLLGLLGVGTLLVLDSRAPLIDGLVAAGFGDHELVAQEGSSVNTVEITPAILNTYNNVTDTVQRIKSIQLPEACPRYPTGANGECRVGAGVAAFSQCEIDCRPDVESLTLRAAGALSGLRIGATLEHFEISDSAYTGTLLREFSALTPENAMKMYSIQNSRGIWTFAAADAVFEFAQANDLPIRGHTLVWSQNQFTPAWVRAINDPEELREVTREYIATVMERYAGRIPRWDVVNEPLATFGPQPSGSVWDDLLGPGWIAEVFYLAHAADPAAELWINEYGTDWVPGKHQAFLALVSNLVQAGVPVHGVGLQTHRISVEGPDRAVFEQQLRDFANLGLQVAITELDVVTSPTDPDALPRQAEAYRRIAEACLAVAACVEITTWGITDADTWLDSLGFVTPTRPLLFDDAFLPKPAYFAVRNALAAGRAP